MPDFQPFRGLRYDAARVGTDLSDVVAPPYDVVDGDRLSELRSRNALNAVHVTLPEGGEAGSDDDRYTRAAAIFRDWRESGAVVVDAGPRFYLYRAEFDSDDGPRTMTGVIGALEVTEPGTHGVLPHERTMPKPAGDRLELLRATRANLEPIWGLSLADGLSALLSPNGDLLARSTDTRGARHHLFAIDDPRLVAEVTDAVQGAAVVIADGHHRYHTSLTYRDEAGASDAGAGHLMALVVELAPDQLHVQPIHRVVEGCHDRDKVLEGLDRFFVVDAAGANEPDEVDRLWDRMQADGGLGVVSPEDLYFLRPRNDGALPDVLSAEPECVRHVDSAVFETAVAPHLGPATVTYRHDRRVVAGLVAKGPADLAVLLRPVDVETIRRVAAEGERMPPKTTFFHPKPSTGLVFRSLDA